MANSCRIFRRSENGIWYYRRKVPADLKDKIGKTEIKTSLKTDVRSEANVKAKMIDAEVEKQFARERGHVAANANELKKDAQRLLASSNFAREQEPQLSNYINVAPLKLDVEEKVKDPSKLGEFLRESQLVKLTEFLEAWQDWLFWEDAQQDEAAFAAQQAAFSLGPNHYETQKLVAAFNILSDKPVLVQPTLEVAVTLYLEDAVLQKQLQPNQLKGYAKEDSKYQDFAEFLGAGVVQDGWQFLLKDISPSICREYRAWWQKKYPTNTNGTWNRRMADLRAAYNFGRKHYELPDRKPFEGLMLPKGNLAAKRRSFTPTEWKAWLQAIEDHKCTQLRLISLICSYTGCRTAEARGVAVSDFNLHNRIAFLKFRSNDIRRLKTDNSNRIVPLSASIANRLNEYLDHSKLREPELPIFPKYTKESKRGADLLSNKQRSLLKKHVGKDPKLAPYSTRHTFASRYRAAGVSSDVGQLIMGHKPQGQSAIHSAYGGDDQQLKTLFDATEKAWRQEDWGIFENEGDF